MSTINFTIDGKSCKAKPGQTIVEASKDNGIYIPTLCHFEGLKPAGTCRICTVKVGGRNMAACTTPVTEGMVVENKTSELEDYRKAIVEMLFVEGNHMCPTCEKSGNCELQALGYRYKMMAPRFPFLFPQRTLDASLPKIIIERNRCVQCLRCVRGITTSDGKRIFGMVNRGGHVEITVD
ncbi:MAG TPA: 2Fe-2S iron-sulfur cluster-binding protein, partial [Spirochaetota bacterium]|nr:2Fe-2S iron-sulfur cluster-binding protein [Spirochaetota bacterium]